MKKIIVYGLGHTGKYIIDKLKNADSVKVVLCIDNFIELSRINEIKIIKESQLVYEEYSDCEIIVSLANECEAAKVTVSLKSKGFNDIYFPEKYMSTAKLPLLDDGGNLIFLRNHKTINPVLEYVEYQVADECNLRCKGCFHFSNLVTKPFHPKIDDFEKELKNLSNKFSNVCIFRLMGGEPLLNKELPRFIFLVRKYFPGSDIRIVTNGILLPDIADDLVQAMTMYNASFFITQYPPTIKIIDRILNLLHMTHINYYLEPPTKKFISRMSFGEADYKKVYEESCYSKYCKFLRNGYIYPCPHVPMLTESKDFFGLSIDDNEMKQCGVDLSDEHVSGWDILNKFTKANSFCRFCSLKLGEIKWETGTPQISDWVVVGDR